MVLLVITIREQYSSVSIESSIGTHRTMESSKKKLWIAGILSLLVLLMMIFAISSSSRKTLTNEESLGIFEISPKLGDNSVIYYNQRSKESVSRLTDGMNDFLSRFNESHPSHVDCDFNNPPSIDQNCRVDLRSFTPCTKENDFGYSQAQPCIFIKFNKVLDWMPEYVNSEVDEDILKMNIIESQKTIWVTCEGKTILDKFLLRNVNYMPWRGFPGYYFPYRGQHGYVEPLIAIQFVNPQVGVPIDIECRITANNFHENINFTILIDG